MIPKIIHYCWLSDDPLPTKYQEYINEWKRLMPDYTIKKWDRKTIDFEKHPFVKYAFAAKKYAFAADYIRVYALYTDGGIYLDSDVKVLQSFDKFLSFGVFTSFENHWDKTHYSLLYGRYLNSEGKRMEGIEKILNVGIQAAIIGSEAAHPYIGDLWNFYKTQEWGDFSQNLKKYTAPTIFSRFCEKYGFRYADDMQLLNNNIAIFPSDIFCTEGINQTPNTQAVHMCAGSWLNKVKSRGG